MSGIFHDGRWYENADLICLSCRQPVYEPKDSQSNYHCFHCGRALGITETEEQDSHWLPPVFVARPVDGITINEAIEYLLDDAGQRRIFENQPAAEAFLTASGYTTEELEHVYFVETEGAENPADALVSYSVSYSIYKMNCNGNWDDEPMEVTVEGYKTIEILKGEMNEVVLKTLQTNRIPDGKIRVEMQICKVTGAGHKTETYEDSEEFELMYQNGALTAIME